MAKLYPNVYRLDDDNPKRFYQLPKELFLSERYKTLNSHSKLLYAILLDRKELSKENEWVDEHGQIYLLFTKEDLAAMLSVSKPTITDAFKGLNKVGLVYEERQGMNKSNRIYVGKVVEEPNKINGSKNSLRPDVKNLSSNDTELNDTELNNKRKGSELEISEPHVSFKTFDYENSCTPEEAEAIEYYLNTYKKYRKKEHPNLKPSQWQHVTKSLFYGHDGSIGAEYDLSAEALMIMIDKHFKTKYKNCDYNILHFVSPGIMARRMYETVY